MDADGSIIISENSELLRRYRRRVEHLFGVDLKICELEKDVIVGVDRDIEGADSAATVRPDDNRTICATCMARNNNTTSVEHAKEYMVSLTLAEEEKSQIVVPLSLDIFNALFEQYDNIEKYSRAVVRFCRETQRIILSGQENNVKLAKNILDQKVKDVITNNTIRKNDTSRATCRQELATAGHFTDSNSSAASLLSTPSSFSHGRHKFNENFYARSRGSGSHDSCSSDVSQYSNPQNISSRTYDSQTGVEMENTHRNDSHFESSTGTDSFDYGAQMEFALKLGYSEADLQVALKTLGSNTTQNKLLGELIRLGSSGEFEDIPDEPDDYQNVTVTIERSYNDSSDVSYRTDNDYLRMRNSYMEPEVNRDCQSNLRPIVIDGSNVAMSHGNKEVFSCQGIKLAVDWFRQRGHNEITVFVPQWRKEASRIDAPITDQSVLLELEKEKILVFTPARRVAGKRVICYDDRFVIKLAAEIDGIVVSNDNYRDLIKEHPTFKKVIEERLLMYSFVKDRFMPPDDPLGRHGPKLDNFLRIEPTVPESLPPPCPYGKKCTYGNKCRFHHPERGNRPHKMVTERLAEQAKVKIQEVKDQMSRSRDSSPDLPQATQQSESIGVVKKTPLGRTRSLVPGQKLPLSRTKSGPAEVAVDSSSHGEHLTKPKVSLTRSSDCSTEDMIEATDLLTLNQVTVSSASDFEKWKSYNKLLSAHRKKIEQAEALDKSHHQNKNQDVVGKLTVTFGRSDSRESEDSVSEEVESQKRRSLPSWSANEPDNLPLPTSDFIKPSYSGGHLALAKKLSDEGMPESEDKGEEVVIRSRSMMKPEVSYHHSLQDELKVSNLDANNGQNTHRKLNRQLSLRGADDPRWVQQMQQQAYMLGPVSSSGSQHYQVQSPTNSLNRRSLPPSTSNVLGHRHHQMREVHFETGSVYKPTVFTDDPMGSYEPYQWGDHMNVMRMSSAPVTYQTEKQNVMQKSKNVAGMTRQNSSSDSQLHLIVGESDVMKVSAKISAPQEGSAYHSLPQPQWSPQQQQQINEPYYSAMPRTRYCSPPPISYQQHMPPSSSQHHSFIQSSAVPAFTNVTMTNVQHIHPPSGNYVMMAPPAGSIQRSGSPLPIQPQQHVARPGMVPSVYRMHPSSNMSMAPPATMATNQLQHQHFMAPSSEQHLNIQDSNINQGQRSSSPMPQKQVHNSRPQMASPSVLESHVRQPPFSQESFVADAMIHPTDPRYPLYYHLCGLFPEEQVRSVMNHHPNETNPQLLCAYIIGMKVN